MSGALASCNWLDTSYESCRGAPVVDSVCSKQHSPDVLPHLVTSNLQASSPHSSTEHQTTLQGCSHLLFSACASAEQCRDTQHSGTASPQHAGTGGMQVTAGSSEVCEQADMGMQYPSPLNESARLGSDAAPAHSRPGNGTTSSKAGGAAPPGWGLGTLGSRLMGSPASLAPTFGVTPVHANSSSMPVVHAQQTQQLDGEGGGHAGLQRVLDRWQPCSSLPRVSEQQQQQQQQAQQQQAQQQAQQAHQTSLYDMDLSAWLEEPASPLTTHHQQQQQVHPQQMHQQQQQVQVHHQQQQEEVHHQQVHHHLQQQEQSLPMSQPWGAAVTGSWDSTVASPACLPMVPAGLSPGGAQSHSSIPAAAAGAGFGQGGSFYQQLVRQHSAPAAVAGGVATSMAGGSHPSHGGSDRDSYQEWLCSIAAAHPLLSRVGGATSNSTPSPPGPPSLAGAGSDSSPGGSSGLPGLMGPLVGLLTGQGQQLPPLQLQAAERALHQHLEKAYQAGYLDGYSHGQATGRATAAAAAAAAAGGGYMPPRPLSGGSGAHNPQGGYRPPPVAWPPPRHSVSLGCPPPYGNSNGNSSGHLGFKRGAAHLELPWKRPAPNTPTLTVAAGAPNSSSYGGQVPGRKATPRGTPHTPSLPMMQPPSMELLPQGSGGLKMYPPLASALPPPAFGAGPPHLSGARRSLTGSRPQSRGSHRTPAPAAAAAAGGSMPQGASQVEQLREVATAAAKAALQSPPSTGSTLDREAAAACLSTLSTEQLLAMASRVAAAATAGVLPVVPELNILSQGCSSR